MYGQGQTGAAMEARTARADVPKAVERVSDINNESINLMEGSVRSADNLLGKTLGPRPDDATTKLPDVPSLMSDARRINILAHQLQARLEELHATIGHDKQ